jgi:4-amino-4-deoxy-L-arabinose transferase-like glycosyltransferase
MGMPNLKKNDLELPNVRKNDLLEKIILFIESKYYVFFGLILLLTLFNLFYKLGSQHIFNWDEARHGVSAYEMLKSGNYIVNTYNFSNDYWNLKPPLSFWTVALGYKLAGFNALGLRLFSAVFAALTVIIVGVYTKKEHGALSSLLAMMVLITSSQYILYHGARTGDPDSLYVFLFTAAILSGFLIKKNVKFIYLACMCFSLAFLTKSWHAGNIPVILVLYLIFTGQIRKLSIKNWMISFVCALVPITVWAVLRFSYDGWTFFSNMINYDLLERSSTTIEDHVGGPFYYFKLLLNVHFYGLWLAVFIIFLLATFIRIDKEFLSSNRRTFLGLIIWILIPLLLFSLAKTKIKWYIFPVFPPLAILIGLLGERILQTKPFLIKLLAVVVIGGAFCGYEYKIGHAINKPTPEKVQSIFQNLKEKQLPTSGKTIYKYSLNEKISSKPYEPLDWGQAEALAAKLYDNLLPLDGGQKLFRKNKSSFLLISNADYKKLPDKSRYKIVDEKNGLMILSH